LARQPVRSTVAPLRLLLGRHRALSSARAERLPLELDATHPQGWTKQKGMPKHPFFNTRVV
ncbi:hypothetical protein C6974_28700, partial [Escherichia coli]